MTFLRSWSYMVLLTVRYSFALFMKEMTLSWSPVKSSGMLIQSSLPAIGGFVIRGGPGGLGPGGGGGPRGPREDRMDWVAG